MKLELTFPLTQGEKDFLRFMLDSTATVESNGGTGANIMETETKQWPPAEAVPEAPAEKPKPKAERKTKVKPKPEPVEEPEAEEPEAEEPEAEKGTDAEPVAEEADTDWIKLATDTAVEMIYAKQRPKVLAALKQVGLDRVSDAVDQGQGKELYEALRA